MDASAQNGPLSLADVQALWQSAVDGQYGDSFVEAGDGNGLEVYGQEFAQLARVSQAIDTSTQAMYVRPWSGQTAPSAAGPALAQVTLTFARTEQPNEPLVIGAGQVFAVEVTNDWSDDGSTPVRTGRRYALLQDLVFLPGESGPFDAVAVAERPGYGYNNPLPGTIQAVDQPGTELNNDLASIVVLPPAALPSSFLVVFDEPDVVVPENVGQYVRLTAGANVGLVTRALTYVAPNPPSDGGRLSLELMQCFESAYVTPTPLVVGEILDLKDIFDVTVGKGRLVAYRPGGLGMRFAYALVEGLPAPLGGDVVGETSGAGGDVDLVTKTTLPVAETETASWEILDWVVDCGLSVTNAASPVGGRLGMLDEYGWERKVYRASGEGDASYMLRVAQLGDTISPNAVRRAANRVLAAIDSAACLREAGDPLYLPGIFYDAGGSQGGDDTHTSDPFWNKPERMFAYDMDFDVRPSDRFKLYLDTVEMRGFFLVGVPFLQEDETGFFYDGDNSDAFPAPNPYDAPPPAALTTFFDGDAIGQAAIYRAVYNAVEAARAFGVAFDLYVESISCP